MKRRKQSHVCESLVLIMAMSFSCSGTRERPATPVSQSMVPSSIGDHADTGDETERKTKIKQYDVSSDAAEEPSANDPSPKVSPENAPKIDVNYCWGTDKYAPHCASLTFTEISDVAELKQLSELVRLEVIGTETFDGSVFGSSTTLKTLYLSGTKLNSYSWIGALGQLEHVNLADTEIRDIGFLTNSTQLRWVDISNTKVSVLRPLRKMKSLRVVYLGMTVVDPQELAQLRRMRPSIEIFVEFCGQSLSLNETRAACFPDEDTDFRPLQFLGKLKTLKVYGAELGQRIADLRKEYPRIRIFHEPRFEVKTPRSVLQGKRGSKVKRTVPWFEEATSRKRRVVVHRSPGYTPSGYNLPGPCVDPAAHTAKSRGYLKELQEGEEGVEHEFIDDLDGDGNKDMLTYASYNINIETMLYVMRGDCGYFVGEFVGDGAPRGTTSAKTRGLFDLIYKTSPVDNRPSTLSVYSFSGRRYRPNREDFRFVPMRSLDGWGFD